MPTAERGDFPTTCTPLARVRDLRGRDIRVLKFPPRGVVLLAGVPGAGKTTLLRRVYALGGGEVGPVSINGGPVILDSEQARNRWRGRLRPIPYRYWRPLVHLDHCRQLFTTVARGAGPIVVHECGTRRWLVRALVWHAGRHGRQVHAVLLDVPAPVAGESQQRRGRRVHPRRFACHVRRWRAMVAAAEQGRTVLPKIATVTLIDRRVADCLRALDFSGLPATTTGTSGATEDGWRGRLFR